MMDRGTVQNMDNFISKNKFEKLVHLVGFIIRIYHDSRSSECQIELCTENVTFHCVISRQRILYHLI